MKTKLKKLIPIFIILIATTIFVSCEKDLYEENIQNSKTVYKTVNMKTLLNKPRDLELFQNKLRNKEKLKGSNSRLVYDSINNFYIDEDYVKYIQMDSKESYTFAIKRVGIEKLENILFNKNPDGTFSSYFVKYDYTPEELKLLDKQQLENKEITYANIEFDENGLMRYTNGATFVCEDQYSWVCNEQEPAPNNQGNLSDNYNWDGYDNGSNSCGWAINTSCSWITIGGGGNQDAGSNPNNNSDPNNPNTSPASQSGQGTGGVSGNTNTTNTTGGVYGNGGLDGLGLVTTPVLPVKSTQQIKAEFEITLNAQQLIWWNNSNNQNLVNEIVDYLTENQILIDIDDTPYDYSIHIINLMINNPDIKINIRVTAKSPANIDMSEVKANNPNVHYFFKRKNLIVFMKN